MMKRKLLELDIRVALWLAKIVGEYRRGYQTSGRHRAFGYSTMQATHVTRGRC